MKMGSMTLIIPEEGSLYWALFSVLTLPFKVHLTETCEQDSSHLITHVETTTAPVSDDARTASIHEGLKQKELLPNQHLVDTGYVDAQLLHSRKPGLWYRSGWPHAP
jgi:hypothetical protein